MLVKFRTYSINVRFYFRMLTPLLKVLVRSDLSRLCSHLFKNTSLPRNTYREREYIRPVYEPTCDVLVTRAHR